MRLRGCQLWVWWLLPFLVARALVPVGFMAQPAQHGLQIVLCQVGQAIGQTRVVTATLNKQQHPSSHWQHDHSCPFAHAASAPVVQFKGGEPVAFIASSETTTAEPPSCLAAGPPRCIANRGPPNA